ncbi:efflux RND transporter periplasmic adaptor subunit [Sediminibacterium soli]|uniref:efflux RND transporter periplasmic adaptor subunit n=1 Tax=Sediminibacterium soli TaxID=2698829 RepID=UPI001379B3D6|nr:efflux RND transporter periplasmic adaptor subunit [Sediminibacterium soli]NCI45979.1 efflux RND transporter periplasmic adaptor subunit [Sediminibacterium soli]
MRNSIMILTCFLYACSGKPKPETAIATKTGDTIRLTEEQVRNAAITTGGVSKKTLKTELVVNGVADVPPQNIVSVSFPLGGYLKSTRLLPGMRVRKGEVIATVEDQALIQLQQDYLVTKTRLEFLGKDFERQKLLNENKVSADKVFQQIQADYQSQKVLLKGYGEKLKLVGIDPAKLDENTISRSISLHSPIDGFVSKVNVNIGKYVTPSEVLFELINPSDIHAALNVFEKDLVLVAPGQKVIVTLVDDPKKEYEAQVLLITRNVDESRSALIHCHFETNPAHLLPGMFLRGRVQVAGMESAAVPEDAVVRHGANEFIVEDIGSNRYVLLPVKTGVRDNGYVAVSIPQGELFGRKVVVKNAYPVLAALRNKTD